MGLDEWERYLKFAREKRSQQQYELELNQSKMAECQAEIDEEPKRQQELAELEKEKAESHVRLIELQMLRQKQQAEEARLKGQRDTLARLEQQLANAQTEQAETVSLIGKRNEQLQACQTELARAPQVKADYEAYQGIRKNWKVWIAYKLRVRPIEDQWR